MSRKRQCGKVLGGIEREVNPREGVGGHVKGRMEYRATMTGTTAMWTEVEQRRD